MTIHINLMIACDLEPDTPPEIIEAIEYVTNIKKYSYEEVMNLLMGKPLQTVLGSIAHDLRKQFGDDNYDFELFYGSGVVDFHKDKWYGTNYKLTLRCGANDFDEIYFPFLEWLASYTDTTEGSFMGYYTDGNDPPTLIYFREQKVHFTVIAELDSEDTDEDDI